MKNFARKFLSVTLAAMMLFSMLPTVAFAADSGDDFYKIVHLDAGRKYFSPDSIKAMIDNAAEAGFNQLELYLSDNQGFRFALEDMTLTTEYGTYDLTPALGDGYSDGSKYPDYSGDYLTQDEMTDIIAYAEDAGIEIVPCINVPGHMGAILEEFTSFRYSTTSSWSTQTSKSSIDLANDEAVAFALALTDKYAEYFASQGCKYYNVGADEYANDLSSMGFEGMGTTLYTKFVEFLNDAADIVIDYGMTPRAFNDGFYYKDYSISVEPNKAYEVCYWSSGWNGYDVASASTIANKGHNMINTHGDYYWVLGNSSWQCSASKASQFDYEAFQSGTITDPAGAMFCIWCDVGNADGTDGGAAVVENTADVIAAFGAVLPKTETVEPEEPEVPVDPEEPEEPVVTTDPAYDADSDITVTAEDVALAGVHVTDAEVVIDGAANVKAWDMTPYTAEGNYTASASVKIPVPAGWNTDEMSGFQVETDGTIKSISGDYADGYYTFTMEHFSVGGIYDVAAAAEGGDETTDTDRVVAGSGTSTSYVKVTSAPSSGTYVIVYNGQALACNGSQITAVAVTENSDGTLTIPGSVTHSTLLWDRQNDGFYNSSSSRYLVLNRSSVSVQNSASDVDISSYSNGFRLYRNGWTSSYYLRYNNGWTGTNNSSSATRVELYKYTEGTQSYTVEAPVQEGRISDLTVSNDGYTDASWEAYQNALTAAKDKLKTVEGTNYPSESAANTALEELIATVDDLKDAYDALEKARTITVTYVTSAGVQVATGTLNVGANAASATLPTSITGTDGNSYSPVSTTLTLTDASEYTVTVQDKAPDGAMTSSTLSIEYFITNSYVYSSNSTSSANKATVTTSTAGVTDAAGVAISDIVAEPGYANYDGWLEVHFWQAMRQDEDNHQINGADDKTTTGTVMTHVRYYNSAWQYKTADGVWHYFLSGDQAVAYYMRHTEITTEITTGMKDWGYDTDGTTPDTSSGYGQVVLSVAVVYPDGTVSPAEDDIYSNSSIVFNYNNNWANTGYPRDIGIIAPMNNSDYAISKMSYTYGSRDNNTSANVWYSTDTITWDKVTNEAGSEWYDEKVVWTKDMGTEPVINGNVNADNVYWKAKNTGILVLIYLETIEKDTNLNVVYWDDDANTEIHDFQIAMTYEQGDPTPSFLNSLKQSSAVNVGEITLDDNAYVTNSSGVNQTFNKNITVIDTIAAKYRTGIYEYVGADISADGTTLTLHYNIDAAKLAPLYIVDFGLPVVFGLDEVVEHPEDVTRITIGDASYGELTMNQSNGIANTVFTYTPSAVLADTEVIKLTLTVGGSTVSKRMGFTPASNVLYEEGFMAAAGWTSEAGTVRGAQLTDPADGTEVVDTDTNPYGYDPAYESATGHNGQYKATVDADNRFTSNLTFTFTGTGFDLIGACGPETGTLAVRVVNSSGALYKSYMIDTAFSDATYGKIYQVPLLHAQNWPHDIYTVTVRGAYIIYSDAVNNPAQPAAASVEDELIDNMGMDADEVEYVSVEENLGISPLDDDTSASSAPASMTLEIDSFRVYRSAMGVSVYVEGEEDIVYVNVLDAIASGKTEFVDAAYTESGETKYEIADYEAMGGPQNEVYLKTGKSVAFKVDGYDTVQVSLRSVSGDVEAKLNGSTVSVGHATEMYYKVTASNGLVTITNDSSSGLLAVGNLKIQDTAELQTIEAAEYAAVFAMVRYVEPDFFVPERLDARVTNVRLLRNKLSTLTVVTSTDVAYLEVNGQKIRPTNTRLVEWGVMDYYTFSVAKYISRNAEVAYEIVAYDADGNASDVYIAE